MRRFTLSLAMAAALGVAGLGINAAQAAPPPVPTSPFPATTHFGPLYQLYSPACGGGDGSVVLSCNLTPAAAGSDARPYTGR